MGTKELHYGLSIETTWLTRCVPARFHGKVFLIEYVRLIGWKLRI